jgi:lysophospholipase L1-like esterase
MTRTARCGAVLAVLTVLLVSACGGSHPKSSPSASPTRSSSSPSAPASGPTYVALGDSYTAGGLIRSFQRGGFRCQRSSVNYPTLVAKSLDLPLSDVSCGGATTGSLLVGAPGLPAQVDAITSKTRAVTVSIGGNDFGLYGRLLMGCPQVSSPDAGGAPCRDRLASQVSATIPAIGEKIGDVLAAVARKAPKADVLLVGYPRLMPTQGSCQNAPYTPGDVAWISSLESQLSATMAAAARAHRVTFVPMYARSKGHDLGAGDAAWVNGLNPSNGDGILLHPNAAGEQAVAAAVTKILRTTLN